MEPPDLPGVEHRWVEARGLRFHVAVAGPPDGAPVFLVHGWPQNWWEWREVIGPLAGAGYRVMAPDLRGLGWSDAPPDGYEKEELASDLLAVLDALGVAGPVRLAGHDWGGWVGWLLCLRAPERFSHFLILNIAHPFATPRLRPLGALWRFWYQVLIAAGEPARPAIARWAGAPRAGWDARDAAIFLGRIREPARRRASVLYYRLFLLRELGPLLAGRYRASDFRARARWLHGAEDRILTPAVLAGSPVPVEYVEGVNHFIVDERPELVTRAALELFAT